MLTEGSRLNPVSFREGEKIKVETKKKNNKNDAR
jgi:predicted DNA-binding antitoxin AbrB/MazE fold protein